MRLFFWRKREDDEEEVEYDAFGRARIRDRSECQHMWGDWTAPVTITVMANMPFGPATEHEALTQTRSCLKCKKVQRNTV